MFSPSAKDGPPLLLRTLFWSLMDLAVLDAEIWFARTLCWIFSNGILITSETLPKLHFGRLDHLDCWFLRLAQLLSTAAKPLLRSMCVMRVLGTKTTPCLHRTFLHSCSPGLPLYSVVPCSPTSFKVYQCRNRSTLRCLRSPPQTLSGRNVGPPLVDDFCREWERYVQALGKFWTALGQGRGVVRVLQRFQQDGATPHSNESLAWLQQRFPDRLISRRCDPQWSPHSPDLNPPDLYLWGYLKARCMATTPRLSLTWRQQSQQQ